MTTLHPVTQASSAQAVRLARKIAADFPHYYGMVPDSFLALKVRSILRFAEDNDIWEPIHLDRLVKAVFRPAFEALSDDDRDYIVALVVNTRADPAARVGMIEKALGEKPDALG